MPPKSCSGAHVTVLALSTSSPALSIALVDGQRVLARHHEIIGRGHAESLVPAIAALLARRRAEVIIVDIGPGSYTGIRIGIAAARALGLAWGLPVYGVSALALVAAQAFASDPALDEVLALVDAGRGHSVGALIGTNLLVPIPTVVTALPAGAVAAGSGVALLSTAIALHRDHPNAAFAGHLPSAALGLPQALYAGD